MSIPTQQEETLALLAHTLEEYFVAVPRQKEPTPPDLMELFARLDVFEKKIDSTYPSQLRHYLVQKSYRKAYLYLKSLGAVISKTPETAERRAAPGRTSESEA